MRTLILTGTGCLHRQSRLATKRQRARSTWQPTRVEASRSGEVAYSTGTYELSYHEPPGTAVTERGKYVEIWRKHADGSWKLAVESFNSDQPPLAAPTNARP